MLKLKVKCWIEDNKEYSNIPKICKYCGVKMKVTDALRTCGLLMVWCPNNICRWCLMFEE